MSSTIEVTGLSFYPIKSCGAVDAEQVTFSEYGIVHDREWMLVGPKGQFLSQRTHPELAVVQTRLEDDRLVAIAPGMGELAIPLARDPDAEIVPVDPWKKPGTGTNEGAEAADYFSAYLGKDVRLLRIQQPRPIRPDCEVKGASSRTAFADGFQILLASANSLAELNEHMDEPVTMDRFRPNIVVEGAPAYDEDYWRKVHIGNLTAFVVRTCARCPIPDVDQKVGVLPPPNDRSVAKALRETRYGTDIVSGDSGGFFGQNVVHVFEPGVAVKVGDTVTVVERADQRNWQAA